MDVIRSNLQPLTRAIPTPIAEFGVSLIGPDCYKTLVLDIDLSATQCLKLGLSKGLGFGIVAASGVIKVPQILKLLNSQSASGVSLLSYFLETASFVVTLAYSARNGFPFSTYGETALIAAQNVVICLLVLKYQGQTAAAGAFLGGLATAGWALQNDNVVDMKMLSLIQAGAGALGVVSKLPQIITIWSEGGTGQLSAFAVFNYLLGSLTRIFTTLQEVDDKVILYGFIAGFLLNGVLAAQMVYYWRSPATAHHGSAVEILDTVPTAKSTGASTGKSRGPTTRRRG
ncbi:uncharacterized protein KY384_001871 [Bacidia gigantensis]|uniref:uncharacterized protein n=1 Tax=Bacidia gigantensis TaxID=2732470 RepID=UPI001D056DEE|nr:uncharacterized protein KY384_001871 [Bacidia gigantensis]KAG8533088.1 hypothetical protein KY384_001871 [Bacidia gigantensis]